MKFRILGCLFVALILIGLASLGSCSGTPNEDFGSIETVEEYQ